MLSIGKLVHGQERYYERTVAQGGDDYYSGRGEAPGEWVGGGARALGLEGRVSGAQLTALLAGDDPRDPRRRLRDALSDSRVAAFDLTFSAPKSVSVLFAVADEATSAQLVAAHEAAVRAALEYLEDEAVFVRRGKGGRRFERAGGLVAAAYRHRMSRALDPQLHTHVVAANLAEGLDGRWTALHHPSLYTHAQTAGYLYEAHLRVEVRERLGLEWRPVRKGVAELDAVAPDVREEFSRRRAEMLAAAADPDAGLSMGTKQQAAATVIATRSRKQYGIETGSWREEVRARAGEHGLGRRAVERIIMAGRRAVDRGVASEPVDEPALGDQLVGAHGLTERSNTFTERDVLRELASAHTQGAAVAELRDQAARFTGRADVLETTAGALTSAELVACEQRLIAAAIGRAGTDTAIVDERMLVRAINDARLPLTGEQAAAVRSVARSGNGVDVIEALAGTGKTYLAGVLRDAYERAGYRVLGVAPTGRAARELADEAGIRATTLDRALLEIDRRGGLPEAVVIVFDEAGMAPTRGSQQLLARAQAAGAKVIAIGDPGQLASVRAGGWLAALSRRLGANRLTEVHRQRNHDERRALAALHDRQPDTYLRWADRAGRLRIHGRHAEHRALTDWRHAVAIHGVRTAVLIARDNELRDRLNRHARAHRRDRGELGVDIDYGPVTLAVGDRVICRRNDRVVDVDNGTRGTIRATHRHAIAVETDAGTIRTLPGAYVAQHVEHAYCLTGHGMQGGTVEHATVLATPRDLTAGWSYTALSRARGQTILHIDASGHGSRAADERHELAPTEVRPPIDHDEVLARVSAGMLVRDDEDLAVDQLRASTSSAGRVDDVDPHRAGAAGPTPQEHGAQQPDHGGFRRQPRALRGELESLRAQRAGLPLQQLARLGHADQQRSQLAEHRHQLAQRLAQLPPPRRLRVRTDPKRAERQQLSAALQAADTQQAALEQHHAAMQLQVGPIDQIRAERDALDRRINQLEHEHRTRLDRDARAELARAPSWLERDLGPRPTDRFHARSWDRAALLLARHRVAHDVSDQVPGLGPQPTDDNEHRDWRQARAELRRLQLTLADRHDRDIGLSR